MKVAVGSILLVMLLVFPLLASCNSTPSLSATPNTTPSNIETRLAKLEQELAILSDKVFGSTTPEYVYIDQRPSSVQIWENIKKDLGSSLLKALNRLWYEGGSLTQDEINKLQKIHWDYPLGYIDFNEWVRSGLRQFREYYEEHKASYVEKEPIPVEPLEDRFKALETRLKSLEDRTMGSSIIPVSLEYRIKALEQKLGIKPPYWP